jgi:hypothetical protein
LVDGLVIASEFSEAYGDEWLRKGAARPFGSETPEASLGARAADARARLIDSEHSYLSRRQCDFNSVNSELSAGARTSGAWQSTAASCLNALASDFDEVFAVVMRRR